MGLRASQKNVDVKMNHDQLFKYGKGTKHEFNSLPPNKSIVVLSLIKLTLLQRFGFKINKSYSLAVTHKRSYVKFLHY